MVIIIAISVFASREPSPDCKSMNKQNNNKAQNDKSIPKSPTPNFKVVKKFKVKRKKSNGVASCGSSVQPRVTSGRGAGPNDAGDNNPPSIISDESLKLTLEEDFGVTFEDC